MRIEKLFAFVMADSSGSDDEGIPSIPVGSLEFPLVGGDMARAEKLELHAQRLADSERRAFELVLSTEIAWRDAETRARYAAKQAEAEAWRTRNYDKVPAP